MVVVGKMVFSLLLHTRKDFVPLQTLLCPLREERLFPSMLERSCLQFCLCVSSQHGSCGLCVCIYLSMFVCIYI